MLKTNALESVDDAHADVDENSDCDRDKDQLLSAATKLCLIYLECEKIIKKQEKVLGPDFDSTPNDRKQNEE